MTSPVMLKVRFQILQKKTGDLLMTYNRRQELSAGDTLELSMGWPPSMQDMSGANTPLTSAFFKKLRKTIRQEDIVILVEFGVCDPAEEKPQEVSP